MMMLLHAIVLVSNLLPAAAQTCAGEPTDIRIVEKIDPPSTDFTKSEGELERMRLAGGIASDFPFTRVAGLTVASIAVDSEIRIANTRSSTGQVCAWPSVVTITLSTHPTVYVSSQHGACHVRAATEHEMQHVAIDREMVERYVGIFRRRIGRMVDAIGIVGPAPEANLSSVRHRIEEKINAVIAITSDELTEERVARQHGLDSPTEYHRLAEACPQINVTPELNNTQPKGMRPSAQ